MAKNRIQIVNWRSHGDDESYCYFGVYPADSEATANSEIQGQVDEDYDWDNPESQPETDEDWAHVIYVNDDFTIEDGEIIEHNGRKFRVSIKEVK